jgi:hypothetical protein
MDMAASGAVGVSEARSFASSFALVVHDSTDDVLGKSVHIIEVCGR